MALPVTAFLKDQRKLTEMFKPCHIFWFGLWELRLILSSYLSGDENTILSTLSQKDCIFRGNTYLRRYH